MLSDFPRQPLNTHSADKHSNDKNASLNQINGLIKSKLIKHHIFSQHHISRWVVESAQFSITNVHTVWVHGMPVLLCVYKLNSTRHIASII